MGVPGARQKTMARCSIVAAVPATLRVVTNSSMGPSSRTRKQSAVSGRQSGPAEGGAARPRAPWGTISRQQVVDAAEKIVSRGDFERMTIRSLAGELDVSPMALYRHVRSKDDLLIEVVDRLFAPRWQPRANRANWRAWTSEAAERFRNFLISQPAALYVYLQHPVVSPTSVARMAAMLDVLRSAGFGEVAARRAYAAVHTYTLGFAALEASRARAESSDDAADELSKELAAFTTPRQFKEGLTFLLDGVEHGHQ
jgi:TetR/AcrR family transcriptional regulator, tetracycline repressor protein